MKKLFILLSIAATLCFSGKVRADSFATNLLGAGMTNLFTYSVGIDTLIVLNSTTNVATVKFFDTPINTNRYVASNWVSWTNQQNYSSTNIWTNGLGIVITNWYTGLYTGPVTNGQATNQLPSILTMVIPASSQQTITPAFMAMRGVTVSNDQAIVIQAFYRRNP